MRARVMVRVRVRVRVTGAHAELPLGTQPLHHHLQVQLSHAAEELLARRGVEGEAHARVLELHLRHRRVQLLVLCATAHLARVRVGGRV